MQVTVIIVNMKDEDYYQDQANRKASSICRECRNKIFPYIEDNTQAFDCGILRGPEDISIFPACDEFPEGCEPNRCTEHRRKGE